MHCCTKEVHTSTLPHPHSADNHPTTLKHYITQPTSIMNNSSNIHTIPNQQTSVIQSTTLTIKQTASLVFLWLNSNDWKYPNISSWYPTFIKNSKHSKFSTFWRVWTFHLKTIVKVYEQHICDLRNITMCILYLMELFWNSIAIWPHI